MDINDAVFTVEEVAEMLRLSKMTVYRLLNNDEISHIRVGRSFRIPGAALDEFIALQTRKAMLR
jgi:excisionase family DNA binding protein